MMVWLGSAREKSAELLWKTKSFNVKFTNKAQSRPVRIRPELLSITKTNLNFVNTFFHILFYQSQLGYIWLFQMLKLRVGSILIFGFSTHATNTSHGLKRCSQSYNSQPIMSKYNYGVLIQLCTLCQVREEISTKENPE